MHYEWQGRRHDKIFKLLTLQNFYHRLSGRSNSTLNILNIENPRILSPFKRNQSSKTDLSTPTLAKRWKSPKRKINPQNEIKAPQHSSTVQNSSRERHFFSFFGRAVWTALIWRVSNFFNDDEMRWKTWLYIKKNNFGNGISTTIWDDRSFPSLAL